MLDLRPLATGLLLFSLYPIKNLRTSRSSQRIVERFIGANTHRDLETEAVDRIQPQPYIGEALTTKQWKQF
jgi:hypothetical protein